MADDTHRPFRRDPDDYDPQRYLAAVNPWWMSGLEGRVRFALERTGFEISRMVTNVDESMTSFWARRGQHAQPVGLDEAYTALRDALNAAECRCGEHDLALAVEDGRWDGSYTPCPPEDDFDAMEFIIAHQPPFA